MLWEGSKELNKVQQYAAIAGCPVAKLLVLCLPVQVVVRVRPPLPRELQGYRPFQVEQQL